MNVVAIDGYSACGKSTLAKDLANHLEWVYVDTGAMYRAVTFYFIQNDLLNEIDVDLIQRHLDEKIHLKFTLEDGDRILYLNGKNVSTEIRSMEVAQKVSQVSALPSVRTAMVQQQRAMGGRQNLIMDGRDIGTVVFPSAFLKIFLTAKTSIRIERRIKQLKEQGKTVVKKEVAQNLRYRDYYDTTRSHSPLCKAEDAILIDNSQLSKVEQNAMVLALIQSRLPLKNGS
jgi:cytidylate kinase